MESSSTIRAESVQREVSSEAFWAVMAVVAAFGSYFCMYAFRKPFTAGTYDDSAVFGLGFKTVLVTAQVFGYMLSKFIGIKFISEMPPRFRAIGILVLVLIAESTLILFGLIPRPWNAICLFLNGLPLGMVFGLVLGVLEGRRVTEALTAGLCASFILADGVTKSVGATLLEWGVPEDWMPAVAGAAFIAPTCLFTAILSRIPPPSPADIAARAERSTLTGVERWSLASRYAAGLIPIIIVFLAVTILRSIRADFAVELWKSLGLHAVPNTYTRSEVAVALGVVAINGAVVFLRDNRRGFFAALATCGFGVVLLAVALVGQKANALSPFQFMVLIGVGLYLPYVAIHTTVFERLLAMTRDRGNIGFLMYVADSIGYLGYVAVMLVENFLRPSEGSGDTTNYNILGLLTILSWLTVAVSIPCLFQAWRYFSTLVLVEPNRIAEATVD